MVFPATEMTAAWPHVAGEKKKQGSKKQHCNIAGLQ
jgi:hypothetical protein